VEQAGLVLEGLDVARWLDAVKAVLKLERVEL